MVEEITEAFVITLGETTNPGDEQSLCDGAIAFPFLQPICELHAIDALVVAVYLIDRFEAQAFWHAIQGQELGNMFRLQQLKARVVLVHRADGFVGTPGTQTRQNLQEFFDERTSHFQVFDVFILVGVTPAENY